MFNSISRFHTNTTLFYFFIIALITASVISPAFSILALILITAYIFLAKDDSKVIEICVLLAPFAAIFKSGIGTTSFCTIVLVVFIIKMATKHGISKKFLLYCAPFLLFVIPGVITDPANSIKQLMTPLFIYYVLLNRDSIDRERIFKVFIFGFLIASTIGYFKNYIPNMSEFLTDKTLRIENGVYANRFSGLNGDPNYYGVNVLLALSLVFYLITKKSMGVIAGTLIIFTLVFYGAQTNSKSFILVLVSLLLFTVYSLLRNKKYMLLLATLSTIFIVTVLISNSKITVFDNLLNRFSRDTNISELTTGRSEIQKKYIDYFNAHPWVYFVGNGSNSELLDGYEAHNTFIQMIYNYGIIGSVILVSSLCFWLKKYKIERNIVNYLPLVVILISYLGLSVLKYNDFPTHMLMILLAICDRQKRTEPKKEIEDVN